MATTTYYGLYIMTLEDTMEKLAQGNETKIDNALHGLRTDVDNKKPKQTAKTDPTASGTSLTFLATFAQNANGEVTVTKKTVATMGAATAGAAGTGGLVPAPGAGKQLDFLRGDGTWNKPPEASANAYGLIKIGYSQNGKNYPVQLSSGKAFVNVPWTDTTYNDVTTSTHGLMTAADKTKLNGIAAGAQVNPGAATQSAAGLMSAADKKKLDGIATGAQVNPGAATSSTYGLIKIGYSQNGKNYPVQLSSGKAFVNVPWTDTTYSDATTSAHGLMSAADKTKLNGIAAGAQVNPGNATTSAAGLMSAADKTKLNGIAAGAQVNPGEATSSAYGLIKIGYSQSGKKYPVKLDSGKAYVEVPWENTTYSNATTSAAGLMSAADKTKLDNLVSSSGSLFSLVTNTSVTSSTAAEKNTYSSRKFSDYSELIFVLHTDTAGEEFADTVVVPSALWASGKSVFLWKKGSSTFVQITYNTDTKVSVKLVNKLSMEGTVVSGLIDSRATIIENCTIHGTPEALSTSYIEILGRRKVS